MNIDWFRKLLAYDLDTSPDNVSAIIRDHNANVEGFPFYGQYVGKRKIWDTRKNLIPVYDDPKDDRVATAMRRIEKRLSRTLFDRCSMSSLTNGSNGIVVSYGTAIGNGSMAAEHVKGHVSGSPKSVGYPTNILDVNGNFDCLLYLNIDSEKGRASVSTVIHEFGHAMGIAGHFNGYGCNKYEISILFWLVLKELYK
ncbi:hypothetical protein EN41_19920 [Agrobacterium tumefaciens]|uniref:Peptidase M10 metallopeptidase domain-containing protein n=1 Tax=Agrobacterium fabrum (strain C58 / ATCC 33970) TaxID=176299 RepID=A9CFR5_AGRFC|nr:hypothetical protein [Agrobacterium fabrum]KEY54455.1 hypothetical protein EN41_19920 [Agrobacterium tumefaciens]AAK89569.1 hypothetical protein Atu3842 [Agrobacterium fabrum str. C58]MCX2875908.1 hypothetical protein [Agrobacterium fabrum]NMV71354.1 hypothetical protein [Agrobacterium fabrum]QQN07962.1 hypothetical protein EML4058_17900 [Agrobacterium fabrum]